MTSLTPRGGLWCYTCMESRSSDVLPLFLLSPGETLKNDGSSASKGVRIINQEAAIWTETGGQWTMDNHMCIYNMWVKLLIHLQPKLTPKGGVLYSSRGHCTASGAVVHNKTRIVERQWDLWQRCHKPGFVVFSPTAMLLLTPSAPSLSSKNTWAVVITKDLDFLPFMAPPSVLCSNHVLWPKFYPAELSALVSHHTSLVLSFWFDSFPLIRMTNPCPTFSSSSQIGKDQLGHWHWHCHPTRPASWRGFQSSKSRQRRRGYSELICFLLCSLLWHHCAAPGSFIFEWVRGCSSARRCQSTQPSVPRFRLWQPWNFTLQLDLLRLRRRCLQVH